jgi:GNAT superfamily N-acetyltransferase
MKFAAMFHEEHRMNTNRRSSTVDRAATLQRMRRLARLMDSAIALPGTRVRIGLDPLLGLIPGAGDVASALISVYMIHHARRLGVGKQVLGAMVANAAADALLGAVPVLGDLFDFAFKANTRNLMLLEKHLAGNNGVRHVAPSRGFVGFPRLVPAG